MKNIGLYLLLLLSYNDAFSQNKTDARVAPAYQDAFMDMVKSTTTSPKAKDLKTNVVNAYALYSYSGWSDKGQILIIDDGDKKRLHYVAPNTRLKPNEIPKFTQEINLDAKAKTLTDQMQESRLMALPTIENNSLDGIEYEFVWLQVKDGNIEIKKRLYMKNIHLMPPQTPGLLEEKNLIKFFQNLIKPNSH